MHDRHVLKARRSRRSRTFAILLGLLWGFASPAAAADEVRTATSEPPTLTGQILSVSSGVEEGSNSGRFPRWKGCHPPEEPQAAGWTIPFDGPVPGLNWSPSEQSVPFHGKFSARLEATLAPSIRTGTWSWACPVTGAELTFGIESPTVRVSGTGTLDLGLPARIRASGSVEDGYGNFLEATFRYTASIVTADGTPYVDRGTQSLRLWMQGRESDGSYIWTAFASELASVEPFEPEASDDTTPPTIKAPYFPFTSSPLAGDAATAVRNKVAWSASDPSGVCRQELERSVDGGPFAPVPLATAISTALVRSHAFGRRYQYRVRATDCAGNVSAFKAARSFTAQVEDATTAGSLAFSPDWHPTIAPGNFLSTLLSTSVGGSVTLTANSRRVAVIAPKGPDRANARVYVDGRERPFIRIRADAASQRRVVWQKSWTTAGEHTIQIVPFGAVLDLDAVATLR
jgi:hypothetical protein